MKCRVIIAQPESEFEIMVLAAESVASLKERISAAQDVPFPESEILLSGKQLLNNRTVSECGVKEGASLDFVVRASESIFCQQLTELLQGRTVPIEELGLLYAHRFGAKVTRALSFLGFHGTFWDFVAGSKSFDLTKKGSVSAKSKNEPIRVLVRATPQDLMGSWIADESGDSDHAVEIMPGACETIEQLAAHAASVANVSTAFPIFTVILEGQRLDMTSKVASCDFSGKACCLKLSAQASTSSLAQQLLELLPDGCKLSTDELGTLFSCRHGVSADQVARSILGAPQRSLLGFLRQQPAFFKLHGSTVARCSEDSSNPGILSPHQRILALHAQASSREFRTEVTRILGAAVAFIIDYTFLSIHHIVTGGAAGVGTAIQGASDAEVTLFVQGLEPAQREVWLPGLLASLAAALEAAPQSPPGLRVLGVDGDAVSLSVEGLTSLRLRISPVFDTHAQALEVLEAQGAALRPWYAASLAEREVQFMKKQPESAKATARLLKLWRSSQPWSSPSTRPSDRLLELLAVYVFEAAAKGSSYDQAEALTLARTLMQDFCSLRVTWSAAPYASARIPSSLLSQRPLLMDPANPFLNVADPAIFSADEMITFARNAPPCLL